MVSLPEDWPTKAISVRQPWAWLICCFEGFAHIPPKRIENRSSLKHIKGSLFIHAGLRFDSEGYYWLKFKIKKEFRMTEGEAFLARLPDPDKYPLGGIVGWANFKGEYVRDSDNFWYAPGQNGLLISDAGGLPFRKCSGRLSLFPAYYPRPASLDFLS